MSINNDENVPQKDHLQYLQIKLYFKNDIELV